MLEKYKDVAPLILILLVIGLIASISLIVVLLNAITALKKEDALIRKENRKVNLENKKLRGTVTKILIVVQSGAEEIVCLRQQMNQVHQWLGEVLNISNLIRSEGGIDNTVAIEELKQRVVWAEQIERQRIEDRDFYEGD